MFDISAITTTNLITIVQILVVGAGFIFSWKALVAANASLTVATSNAQAQLYNQMVVQGRDLQFKFAELFHSSPISDDLNAKQDQFVGTLIGYYSSCFELKNVLPLPANVQRLLDSDLSELLREKKVRDKWDEIKHLHSSEFVEYVSKLRGVK